MTADADRDAIALIRASLNRDEEAMRVILRHCDPLAMAHCMAELFSFGTRRGCNDPEEQLDRCLAAVDSFIAAHEAGERRGQAIRDWIALCERPPGERPADP